MVVAMAALRGLAALALATGLLVSPGIARGAAAADPVPEPAAETAARTSEATEPAPPIADRAIDTAAPDPGPGLQLGPSLLLYQGRLTDTNGNPLAGPVALVVSLYTAATGGSALWTESYPSVSLTSDGIYTILLGSVTPFPAAAFSEPDRWIGTSVNGGAELTPRMRVASVPFALEANRLNGKRSTDFDPAGTAAIAAAGVQSQLNGSDASPPNVGSNQVHWNNLYGVPLEIADGRDSVGAGVTAHGQLSGLDLNDHPQYLLGAAAATTDGNPPNLGSNRLHWDNLNGVPGPIVNQQFPTAWILPGAIDSTRLADGQILPRHLAEGAFGSGFLAPGSVTSVEVADGSLTGEDIANSSLTGDDIQNGTLTGADILDGSISGQDLSNLSITGSKIALKAVGPGQLGDEAVGPGQLAPGAVGTNQLGDSAVVAGKIGPGAVGTVHLAPGSVGAAQLQAGAVDSNAVTDGGLSDADLATPPGLDFLQIPGFVDTVTSLADQVIAEVTLDVPGPGWIVATGGAQVFLLHDTGTLSRCILSLGLGGNVPPAGASATVTLPASNASELYSTPAQLQFAFAVTAPGPVVVQFVARKGVQPRLPSLHDVRLQAVYYPRRY
jgi:hypothetical protein